MLGLHRVLKEEEIRQTNSEPAIILKQSTFAAICGFLQTHFNVVPLASLLNGPPVSGFSKPLCVITFDDGWADNYSNAFPILQQYGLPATIFLATGMISSGSTFWIERLRAAVASAEGLRELQQQAAPRLGKSPEQISVRDVTEHLKRMPSEERMNLIRQWLGELPPGAPIDRMMTWDEVASLANSGLEFGSHTDTHPLLPYEPRERVAEELRSSREKLKSCLQLSGSGFAYPNGSWNDLTRQQVSDAGYSCAVTTRPGWFAPGDDVYCMNRVLLHEGNVTGSEGKFSCSVLALTLMGWR